jgi:hypothetical protein
MRNVLNPDVMATSEPGSKQDEDHVEPVSGDLADKNVIRSVVSVLDVLITIQEKSKSNIF